MPRAPLAHKPRTTQATTTRLSAHRRGYDRAWQALRLRKLDDSPWCEQCYRETGRMVTHNLEIDHIVPIDVRPDLRLEIANLQTLCAVCHGRKTRREHGRNA